MTNEHFSTEGGVIAPQLYMQHRLLADAEAASLSRTYSPVGGGNKNGPVHTVDVKWTNNTPVGHQLYGMVTRGGAYVSLAARSRGYFVMSQGVAVLPGDELPEDYDFDMVEDMSKFGGGMSVGVGGTLAVNTGFGVHRVWKYSQTALLMPQKVGLYYVEPGETLHARVDVKFRSDFWESSSIDGGDSGAESGFISGGTLVELFGIPDTNPPGSRLTPMVVDSTDDVNVATATATVDVPDDIEEGDVILVAAANRLGSFGDIDPDEPGWTLLHARNGGALLDSYLKLYVRIATDDEPDSYSFTDSGFWVPTPGLSEVSAQLIVLRDASHDFTEGWRVASSLLRVWRPAGSGHVCPSIDRAGQLLICGSFFAHPAGQAPIHQTPPEDMTEVSDIAGSAVAAAVAVLPDPPRPTRERVFMPSISPQLVARSIAWTVLVSGALPV